MHRVPGLESNHPAPTTPNKFLPQLGRSWPQSAKIVMRRQMDTLQATAHIPGMRAPQQVVDTWMFAACRTVYLLRLLQQVRLPDLFNLQSSQHRTFRVTKGQHAARTDGPRDLFRHVERNRDGPQCVVS